MHPIETRLITLVPQYLRRTYCNVSSAVVWFVVFDNGGGWVGAINIHPPFLPIRQWLDPTDPIWYLLVGSYPSQRAFPLHFL